MRVVSALILTAFLPLARCQTSGLVFSRVLPVLSGGTGGSGTIDAIAVDAAGNTYLAGSTENPAFPVTPGAPQSTFGGGTCIGSVFNPLLPPPTYPCDDAFVAELDPQGNILFATYLGGAGLDRATSMALDAAGNIYVAGTTGSVGLGAGHNFPTTPGGPFGNSATGTVFLAKINPAAGWFTRTSSPDCRAASWWPSMRRTTSISPPLRAASLPHPEPSRAKAASRWASSTLQAPS
jgi:hypothetical protein